MVKHLGTKPGKCNTGRWGAVGDVERYYSAVLVEVLHEIMDDAFFTEIDKTDGDDEVKLVSGKPVDDVQMDDMKAYKQNMGGG